ncbi:C4-dicarboxylate TRAP transporter substrate-binding protein [Seohaeicola zhoushanensis]|uniref:C4-dicarboxylate ABC transporter substrate-binding protein n=1 Tax=Seohaeicola zhoushanensis TaxID=1569283 RepID=A0A8J3M9L2_9RHOB|nr:C4-dicarboxylate TRAP transporter substrate-binding protein [Seohaeicola zhoushanensis]GHF67016.1 hypothetical protein GCM10017056_42800 [Seohaeicola zhoushanensis]
MNLRSAFVMGSALLVGAVTSADAEELRYAVGYPPGAAAIDAAESAAKIIANASGGELTVKVYTSALLSFGEMEGGIRDGIADIGYMVTPYFPKDFPRTNLLNDMSMQLSNVGADVNKIAGMAYGGAMMEYIILNCPDCLAEYKAQNMVFTGVGPTASYHLLCNQPVTSAEALKGKRLRAGAGQWNRWAVALGASPVQITGQESLEAMKQGIIDCTVLSTVTALKDFQLINAVTDITLGVPGGVFAATPATTVNADVWKGLDTKKRSAFLRGAAYMSAAIPFIDHSRETAVVEEAAGKGIKTHEPEADLKAATASFLAQDASTVAELYSKAFGVANAPDMMAAFRPLLEKWVGLVNGIASVEDLAALYEQEIYSKIDFENYGN